MRKEIKEFVARMDCNTTLEEIKSICQNEKEMDFVLENFQNVKVEDEPIVLSLSLRLRAKLAFEKVPIGEITTILVQKKLSVSYSEARRIVELLKQTKEKTL